MPPSILRNIPSVNELLDSQPLKRLSDSVSRRVVVSGVRSFLETLRQEAQTTANEVVVPVGAELAERIASWIMTSEQAPLRPVINATGILLHTGLGRAPLAPDALSNINELAEGYCSLEVDLESGKRSHRHEAVEKLLRDLTGAEASFIANNNAGATLLTLAALAGEREVIVSRGELVEIGGSYRLPNVMEASGARLREIGTTNKTRLDDYEKALSAETGALLKVHTSNYAIVGFTEEVSMKDLAPLAHRNQLPVIHDIGSGALVDYSRFGLVGEPVVTDSIQEGADVVLFSGDKLLGGPQCGIIVGRRTYVEQIRKHPLARAFRVGKLTLAALAATLRHYRDPEVAEQRVPLLSLLSTSVENLKLRAERLAPQLAAATVIESAESQQDVTYLGGGSVPGQQIPTWCVALQPATGSIDQLAHQLRTGTPAIFGRLQQDHLLLDLRSVFPSQDEQIVETVCRLEQNEPVDEVQT
ncbi:MAG: L-seryl-tRNA(Sec) selenium transferase [Pirellulaceae bacterium]|nr:L-seryl-tRNA(Sec) selenium transferase [Pirellulaceae bacterium]